MNLKLNRNQRQVLWSLLNCYEKSKTYKNENVRKQSFSIEPKKIYPDYNGDFADVDVVNQFNRDMNWLEKNGFVILKIGKNSNQIEKIILNLELLKSTYALLDRKDITEIRSAQIELYKQYRGIHPIIDAFCDKQIERLCNFKDAEYNIDIAQNILRLLKYILLNTRDIMERELSIEVLGDTKLFKNSYMTRICKIIETYGLPEMNLEEIDAKEKKKVILEEFHVFLNPSYIFFKGNVTIRYNDGNVVRVQSSNPIAISSDVVEQIEEIRIGVNKVITVENLTSYNRMNSDDSVFLFLSGYHNTAKQKFLKKIANNNKNVKWYHFGDIDPDGYYILKNLIQKTGISFQPINMDKMYLEDYRKYCKKLEKNDVIKAQSLIECQFFEEEMEYMLKHNCKLEQEIISWLENGA
ncbi:MAG: DUF2220 domain-containing protein [Clostridium sp.]|nr:DUF2220 domain-containing protein [Clostridium sp.]